MPQSFLLLFVLLLLLLLLLVLLCGLELSDDTKLLCAVAVPKNCLCQISGVFTFFAEKKHCKYH